MQKKNLAMFIFSIAALMVVGIISSEGNLNSFNNAGAEGSGYSIPFTSTANKFSSASGTQSIATSLGNPISFSYNGYSGALGKWGNLAAGGYLANQTALSGLSSLSVTYGTATGNLAISYGWWDSASSSIVYEFNDGLITSTSTFFTFDNYFPSYFKITASASAQISSMTVTYICAASEDPFPSPIDKLTFRLLGSEYSVINCDESAVSISIPPSYKDLPVTSIGTQAFSNCFSLVSVTIPSSVTIIGTLAFQYCRLLASVTIPSSVTNIGDKAFIECSSLTSIAFPSSVTNIGNEAFFGCSSLTLITIPSSVTQIGDGAFSNCLSLTSISVESGNPYYSSADGILFSKMLKTLYTCPGGKTSITIPSSVTAIGYKAFYGCALLTSIVIPSSVTSVGDSAFRDCTALTYFTIPSSVTNISSFAFSDCTSLISVIIPSSITTISTYTFSGCTSLTSIAIPSSVTWIRQSAFGGCTSLKIIAIPSSVTTIEDRVFQSCNTLLTIKCQASFQPFNWNSSWNINGYPVTWGATNRGNVSTGGVYWYNTAAIPWESTNASIASFSNYGKTIDIPSTIGGYIVNNIASTFTGYSSINYLRIPDSITTISANALTNMSSLNTIIIGSGVTSIGAGAFTGSLPTNTYSTVYFKGTPSQWTAINFTYFESNGDTMVYYSETEHLPDANYYWHYDVDGMTPTIWGI